MEFCLFELLPFDHTVKIFDNLNFQELGRLTQVSKDCKAAVEEVARHIFKIYQKGGLLLKGQPVILKPTCSHLSNLFDLQKNFIVEISTKIPDDTLNFKAKYRLFSLPSCVPANSNLLKLQQVEQQRSQKENRELFLLWDVLTLGLKGQPSILDIKEARFFNKQEITAWLQDPKNKNELAKVKKLDLSGQNMEKLPLEIKYLWALNNLILCNNQLRELPIEIKELKSLENLDLTHNKLYRLINEIKYLSSLKELHLSHNPLAQLPSEIGDLVSLQKLCSSSTQLTHLPTEIGRLHSLKTLDLTNNLLNQLPAEIGQLCSLINLFLEKNQLTELPREMGNLQSLQVLYLHENSLTELPINIMNLPSLQVLYSDANTLTELLPEGFLIGMY